jgi:hypothetical protein
MEPNTLKLVLESCERHKPVQHRDGKPPWCNNCGLTKNGQVPKPRLGREK